VDGSVPEQRILEQSVRLPEGGAVTGWAACRIHGANFFDGLEPDGCTPIPVPLAVGPGHRLGEGPEAELSRERLDAAEIVVRNGMPCTTPMRALFDEMRRVRDWREAVVAMDMMAAAELVSISQMRAYRASHADWKRSRLVSTALEHASEDSRSPNEVRMRLVWEVEARLPRPLVNQPVFTLSGRLIGIADLLDPVAGVVGEFDGADHRAARRHSKDVRREDDFRRHGLEYFKVTGPDLPDRALVARRMLATRSRARWLSAARRSWTIEPPPWWQPAPCLDEVLAHRAWLRLVHEQDDPDIPA
jgi:hypothetical protein